MAFYSSYTILHHWQSANNLEGAPIKSPCRSKKSEGSLPQCTKKISEIGIIHGMTKRNFLSLYKKEMKARRKKSNQNNIKQKGGRTIKSKQEQQRSTILSEEQPYLPKNFQTSCETVSGTKPQNSMTGLAPKIVKDFRVSLNTRKRKGTSLTKRIIAFRKYEAIINATKIDLLALWK